LEKFRDAYRTGLHIATRVEHTNDFLICGPLAWEPWVLRSLLGRLGVCVSHGGHPRPPI
jgi:hypothetical protein